MKKRLTLVLALLVWFALVIQYIIMLENRTSTILEATTRFFSFYTILTNLMVALYATARLLPERKAPKRVDKPGVLSALTVYMVVVGLVYQFVLRSLWEPTGLERVADELLHTVIPLLVVVYWFLYEKKARLLYSHISYWLLYPFVYLGFILLRGHFAGFYPYPFVDVPLIGYPALLVNVMVLFGVFTGLSFVFIWLGKRMS